MKYRLADLDSDNDRYGIREVLGDGKLALKLSLRFEDTSPKVWGNILKGREASGKYGEVIASIKRYGFKEACNRITVTSKNRHLRHIVVVE